MPWSYALTTDKPFPEVEKVAKSRSYLSPSSAINLQQEDHLKEFIKILPKEMPEDKA